MPSEVRQKKNYGKIKSGPKMLNFGASKPRVKGGGAWAPGPPLDPRLITEQIDNFCRKQN